MITAGPGAGTPIVPSGARPTDPSGACRLIAAMSMLTGGDGRSGAAGVTRRLVTWAAGIGATDCALSPVPIRQPPVSASTAPTVVRVRMGSAPSAAERERAHTGGRGHRAQAEQPAVFDAGRGS